MLIKLCLLFLLYNFFFVEFDIIELNGIKRCNLLILIFIDLKIQGVLNEDQVMNLLWSQWHFLWSQIMYRESQKTWDMPNSLLHVCPSSFSNSHVFMGLSVVIRWKNINKNILVLAFSKYMKRLDFSLLNKIQIVKISNNSVTFKHMKKVGHILESSPDVRVHPLDTPWGLHIFVLLTKGR